MHPDDDPLGNVDIWPPYQHKGGFFKRHPFVCAYVVFSLFAFLNTGFLGLVWTFGEWLWGLV